jgi:hypothetical protein
MIYRIFSIFTITIFYLCSANANVFTLDEALKHTINHNIDIKLENSRYEQIKSTKGDGISGYLQVSSNV